MDVINIDKAFRRHWTRTVRMDFDHNFHCIAQLVSALRIDNGDLGAMQP